MHAQNRSTNAHIQSTKQLEVHVCVRSLSLPSSFVWQA